MSLYWPDQHLALQIDDDPLSMPFDKSSDPRALVVHIKTSTIIDPVEMDRFATAFGNLLSVDPAEVADGWRNDNPWLQEMDRASLNR